MGPLTLTLLGGFQARLGSGPPLTLPTKKIQAFLAYLALPPGREHSRDKLAALLWGDLSQGHARNSLRQALFALRRAVEPVRPACLCVEGATIALNADGVDVDAIRFERLVSVGTPEALGQAVELYRGDLLDGLTLQEPPFEEWLMAERERLRELAVEALARVLAAQRAAGALDAALQTGLRLIALDPLQESVHRTLMRLYAQLGRRGSALHQYQLCVGVLQRELGVEPEEETKALYQEILRRRPVVTEAPEPATTSGVSPSLATLRGGSLMVATDTPLIGRDQEMARLRAMLAEAVSGQGQVVAIVGEAGVGKTRLVAELATEALKVDCQVLLGRCHEAEQILPFGPWVDALRSGDITEATARLRSLPLQWRAELIRLLPDLGPDAAESRAGSPHQLNLFAAVTALLHRLAASQAIVLILEDLHWADEMTLRLVTFVSHRVQGWPILVVATTRQEELPDLPLLRRTLAEVDREAHAMRLALTPLGQAAAMNLVRMLARTGSTEADLVCLGEEIWRISEGNPFVVVETMRALDQGVLSRGSTTLSLPERARELIALRLDRLSERSQHLVAIAAVIGREFEFALVQRVADGDAGQGIEELVRRGLLAAVGDCFAFTHDRIREEAYRRLLSPRRKWLHRQVAEAMRNLYASELEPHHLALGLHYAEGEVWDKAVVHLRRAGARAVERSANREALVCFERALAALAHLPESKSALEQGFEIRVQLRPVLNLLREFRRTMERLREAEALAEALNDDGRRGLICALMTNGHTVLGELDDALVTGPRALTIARRLGDLRLRLLTTTYLEQAHYFRGEYERVVELATDNLRALPADWVHEFLGSAAPLSIMDRTWLIRSLAELGRFADAADDEAEAIRLAGPTHHSFTVSVAHLAAGILHLHEGDWGQARTLIERAIAELRTGRVVVNLGYAVASSALVLAQLGESSEALDRLQEGEQLLGHAGRDRVGNRGWSYQALGRAALVLGRLDQARHLAHSCIECSPVQPAYVAHALRLLGDVATHPDGFDAEGGEDQYRKALALAEPRGMRPLVAHCHVGLGKLYQRHGEHEQARTHVTTGIGMYREMGMQFWLEKAEAEASVAAFTPQAPPDQRA